VKRITLIWGLLGLFSIGPKPAYADPLSLTVGPLTVNVPFSQGLEQVTLYDFNKGRMMLGAETSFADLWYFEGTVGGVTSLQGDAIPFLGIDLKLSNIITNKNLLPDNIEIGGFIGNDFKGSMIYGAKASIGLF